MTNVSLFLRSRRYLVRIFSFVAGALTLLLTLFSVIYYTNVQRRVIAGEHAVALRELIQVRHHIALVDEMVRNASRYVYFHPATQELLVNDDVDHIASANYALYRSFQRLLAVSSVFDSLYLFNANTGTVYSTDRGIFRSPQAIDELLTRYPQLSAFQPVLRRDTAGLIEGGEGVWVLSYFLGTTRRDDEGHGGVLFNIDPGRLLGNIHADGGGTDDRLFIVTDEGLVIDPVEGPEALPIAARQVVTEREPSGHLVIRTGGDRFLISYAAVERLGWTVVRMRPYRTALALSQQLRRPNIIITVLFLTFVVLTAVFVSLVLYRPVRRLVEAVEIDSMSAAEGGDSEFEILQDAYADLASRLDAMRLHEYANTDTLKRYSLRTLFIDSFAVETADVERRGVAADMEVDLLRPLIVAVARIDGLRDLAAHRSDEELELLKLGTMKEATDILAEHRIAAEAAPMPRGRVGILINTTSPGDAYIDTLTPIVRSLQRRVAGEYGITVSVALSEPVDDVRAVTQAYNQAREWVRFRKVRGRAAVITAREAHAQSHDANTSYPEEIETCLLDHLARGEIEEATADLAEFFGRLTSLRYHDIGLSIARLLVAIQSKADDIGRQRMQSLTLDLSTVYEAIFTSEPLDTVQEQIAEWLKRFASNASHGRSDKSQLLVQTVDEIIAANITDGGLCLKTIAGSLHLSPAHVGKVYKRHQGFSVANAINEMRLTKASELILSRDMTVTDVIAAVGIQNETYFYRLFKQRFGTTPREFVLRQAQPSKS